MSRPWSIQGCGARGYNTPARRAHPLRRGITGRRCVMNWLILIVAGLFEVIWAVALKMSNGFKNITADAVFVGGMAASVWLLAVAMKSIPMGTAYAVWTGVGAVGGFVAGIALFGESASAMRIASAALIVAGIVGLKLAR